MEDILQHSQPIPGYPLHRITRDGEIYGPLRKTPLKPAVMSSGYLSVNLCYKGKAKTFLLHRLLAEAFVENPEGHDCVDHLDRDRLNNTLTNLRWCSRLENSRNRTKQQGTSTPYIGVSYNMRLNRYVTYIKAEHNQEHLGVFDTAEEAARKYNRAAAAYGFMHRNILPEELTALAA